VSDTPTREEFEQLRDRVAELEARMNSGDGATDSDGVDHRDETVLEHMREHGKVSKRSLADLYIQKTDIRSRKTAKRRAKQLERREVYRQL